MLNLCLFSGGSGVGRIFKAPVSLLSSIVFLCSLAGVFKASGAASNSVARVWDERALSAIRVDSANPPVHARNLFSLSVAMYDAWAAYDPNAVGYVYHGKHT